jgi:transcriptional regulator with XRE-family HTH domain
MSPVTASTIGAFIREQREQAKISMRQLAQAAGVSNPYLSQVERGLRRPSADILQQIAKGLRISAEALYVQAGILDDRPADTSVPDAIMTDPELTERQKQMLIEIYESFRKEVRADAEARAAESAELDPAPDPALDPAPAARTPDQDAASGAAPPAEPGAGWPDYGDRLMPVCGTAMAAAEALASGPEPDPAGTDDQVSAATANR